MADHVEITLWIDRRWKDAIEKHLRDETLEEHLEDAEQVKLDSERDHWMTADEAQAYGLVDKVIYKR